MDGDKTVEGRFNVRIQVEPLAFKGLDDEPGEVLYLGSVCFGITYGCKATKCLQNELQVARVEGLLTGTSTRASREAILSTMV